MQANREIAPLKPEQGRPRTFRRAIGTTANAKGPGELPGPWGVNQILDMGRIPMPRSAAYFASLALEIASESVSLPGQPWKNAATLPSASRT